jgi:2-oxoglutarate ferredoxin oxidoreductase subunit delta
MERRSLAGSASGDLPAIRAASAKRFNMEEAILSKVIMHKERCKACGFCIRECPRKAIAMTAETNSKGYTPVRVDDAKCVGCGICYWVCPDCVFEVEA